MVCESNEALNAAWIDGETAWVVAVRPNGSSTGNPTQSTNAIWTLGSAVLGMGAPAPYLTSFKGSTWLSGNSSDHQGNIVMHAFGDTHVAQITGDVEPRVYMAICTRGGAESDSLQE